MANYTQYIPQVNSTTYPTSISNCFTALTADVTALENGKLALAGGTMTGIPAFNGGESGVSAPFTVDSNFVVTNLNADLLDGLNGSNYLRSDVNDTFSGALTISRANNQSAIIVENTTTTNELVLKTFASDYIGFRPTPLGVGDANQDFFYNFTDSRWQFDGSSTPYVGTDQIWHAGNLVIADYATLASPTFTGTPSLPTGTTAITQTAGNSTTRIATTAFVNTSYAPKASPTFTGVPAAPTATAGTSTTQLATTAFVTTAIASIFASGTAMLFQQTAAPTGWTKQTTHNDKSLRVVTGTVGSGGTKAFTTTFGTGKATDSYTLLEADIPSHIHNVTSIGVPQGSSGTGADRLSGTGRTDPTTATGGGGGHAHPLTNFDVQYVDIIIATKD